ncbi:MAG: sulfur reduction protein DsrE [Pseudomonadota bacterium]
MNHYVLIASKNWREAADANDCFELGAKLAEKGNTVAVFMVQNGVLTACDGAPELLAARDAGVMLLADAFSLRERGISTARINESVRSSTLDFVIDRMAAGDKVIWH